MSYEELKAALMKFYSDKSRSKVDTATSLRDLSDEIEMLIDSLRE